MEKFFQKRKPASKISIVLVLGFMLWGGVAHCEEEFRFHYDADLHNCVDNNGVSGYNIDFLGECGVIKNKDLTYARLIFPPSLKGSILAGSNLTSATLSEIPFDSADLSGVNFTSADLIRSNFNGANVKNVIWTKAFLYGANLERVDLTGADFRGAGLISASLKKAKLRSANFTDDRMNVINLSGADLSNAKLSGTYLYGADMTNTDLTGTDLTDAIIFGADLSGADTEDTIFTNTKYDDETVLPFDNNVAKQRGMKFFSSGQPQKPKVKIFGGADGSCSPVEVHLSKGVAVEFILNGVNQMFILKAPDFGVDLMAMAGQSASKVVTPRQSGTFPFTCGVHGSTKVTTGKIMVM